MATPHTAPKFDDVLRNLRDMGLRLTPQDVEKVRVLYDFHQERLKVLYAADLEQEEPSVFYVP